jgi:hypothetical protein
MSEVEEKTAQVDAIHLAEWVSEFEHPNVVKKTVSWLSNSADPYLKVPVASNSHIFSRRSSVFDQIIEGDMIYVPMSKLNSEKFGLAIEGLNNTLERENGPHELTVMISPRGIRFGLVLTQYFSYVNWNEY